MKEWQFNVLFFVGVGSAIFLLIAPELGMNVSSNPTALAGVGSILTYILTQKKSLTKNSEPKGRHQKKKHEDDEEPEIKSVYGDPDDKKEDE